MLCIINLLNIREFSVLHIIHRHLETLCLPGFLLLNLVRAMFSSYNVI
jgi:hypothetical protein